MSKFFAQAGSDSETESDESEVEQIPVQKSVAAAKTFQLSDDEEDSKRLVRSAKDKREEEINIIAKHLKNHKKIRDMCKVLSGFEDLQKAYAKAKGVLDQDGHAPDGYLKYIVELEDFVNECWEDKEFKKSMSKNNSRGLSSLRQKLKKYTKDFEEDLKRFREKESNVDIKELSDDDKSVESQSDIDDDKSDLDAEPKIKEARKKPLKRAKDLDDDDYSSDWGDSESDESSESDDEKYAGNLAAKFLKKIEPEGGEKEKKKDRATKSKEAAKKDLEGENEVDEDDEDKGKWESVTAKGASRGLAKEKVVTVFAPDEEITREAILKKLGEILATRGKRGGDRADVFSLLPELLTIAQEKGMDAPVIVKITFNLIASYFDYNGKLSPCMKPGPWENCLKYLGVIIKMLEEHPEIKIGTHIIEDSENLMPGEDGTVHIKICVLSLLEIADEEYTKILQNCDAHSTEYIDRLKDEKVLCQLIADLQRYLEKYGLVSELCRIYFKRVEHMYYKIDPAVRQVFKNKEAKKISLFTEEEEGRTLAPSETGAGIENLEKYCKYIYAHDDTDRMRTRAILCHIYYCSLHDDWYKARDLLLMSHLQDTIQHSDTSTQTLYNRAMVQLGLCAFRHGLFKDAHDALLDIQSSGRAKELLGQGLLNLNPMARGYEPMTQEQEKADKLRQVPFHLHINLDVLEFVYLVCAMCLETPYIALGETDRRRMASKNFYYQLKISDRQLLSGPPDTIRDHIVAAHKAMKVGDWKACRDFVMSDKIQTKVWDLFYDTERVCDMLVRKIKVESLRVYIFAYGNYYDSINLSTLCAMFDLGIPDITNIISKMILNDEIMAAFDESSQTLMMYRVEPNRLQTLVLQLVEKVAQFQDVNEKYADLKQTAQVQQAAMATGITNPYQSNYNYPLPSQKPSDSYYNVNPSSAAVAYKKY